MLLIHLNNLGDFLIYDRLKNMITVLNKDIQINEIILKISIHLTMKKNQK